MPYIKPEDRPPLDVHIDGMPVPQTVGELNYVITRICHRYLLWHGGKYEHFNGVVGVLECAKLELYRRVIASYEDRKIAENGDVKPL